MDYQQWADSSSPSSCSSSSFPPSTSVLDLEGVEHTFGLLGANAAHIERAPCVGRERIACVDAGCDGGKSERGAAELCRAEKGDIDRGAAAEIKAKPT